MVMPRDLQASAESLLVEQTEPFVITVNGYCMQPLLNMADRVIIKPASHYLPGEVILFNHPLLGLTVHRLLGLTLSTQGLRYMTKADSSNQIDRMLQPQDVLGQVDRNLTRGEDIRPTLLLRVMCAVKMLSFTLRLVLKKMSLK